jgi:hypothetical protein
LADIELTQRGATAFVTLNRPSKRNAVTLSMWRDIARLFGELSGNDAVRAIMLTGAGGNFSVGADISEFASVRDDIALSAEYEVAVDAATEAIAGVVKPTIAVVDGFCLGGGCHLAMACDFRLAKDDASFGIPAARLSIVYGFRSTQRLLALVGVTQAKRILFSVSASTRPKPSALAWPTGSLTIRWPSRTGWQRRSPTMRRYLSPARNSFSTASCRAQPIPLPCRRSSIAPRQAKTTKRAVALSRRSAGPYFADGER